MHPIVAIVVKLMMEFAAHIPRSSVAKVARQLLELMAVRVEELTTNTIVHEAETVTFGALDALLLKIENANV